MARKPPPVPPMKRHKNGQAFVYHRSLPGKSHVLYLGKYGSAEANQRYEQFLRTLRQESRPEQPALPPAGSRYLVRDLVVEYMRHCETYYRDADGKQTREFSCTREALRPVLELFGDSYAAAFSVEDLERYRQALIGKGMARTTINGHAARVRRMFRRAAAWGLIPASIWHELATLEGLKAGRTAAVEPEAVEAVDWETVSLVLPHCSPVVAAMIEVQFWGAMRPQDVCRMRQCDLDTTGDVWLYKPAKHKNAWRGHSLVKAITPHVQPLLQAFFRENPEEWLFSPRDAVIWHARQKSLQAGQKRTTPVYPSETKRLQRKKDSTPARPRNCYTTDTYRQAVEYGQKKLNRERAEQGLPPLPIWSPMQLRHGVATFLSRRLGVQASQKMLGHKSLATTQIYLEQEVSELVEIARRLAALTGKS